MIDSSWPGADRRRQALAIADVVAVDEEVDVRCAAAPARRGCAVRAPGASVARTSSTSATVVVRRRRRRCRPPRRRRRPTRSRSWVGRRRTQRRSIARSVARRSGRRGPTSPAAGARRGAATSRRRRSRRRPRPCGCRSRARPGPSPSVVNPSRSTVRWASCCGRPSVSGSHDRAGVRRPPHGAVAVGRAAVLVALERQQVGRVRSGRVGDDREAEVHAGDAGHRRSTIPPPSSLR